MTLTEYVSQEHAEEMTQFKETLSKQKDKQVNSMKARLEERRRLKVEKLKARQQSELDRVSISVVVYSNV